MKRAWKINSPEVESVAWCFYKLTNILCILLSKESAWIMHASKLVCDASTVVSLTADGGPDVQPQTPLSDVMCGENICLDTWGTKSNKLLEGQLYIKNGKKKKELNDGSATGICDWVGVQLHFVEFLEHWKTNSRFYSKAASQILPSRFT